MKEFDWETAERVDLKPAFIQQSDLVFLNITAKGYNRESDVRYAFSQDEILIELRDLKQNKVHRLCQTLTK